MYITVVYYDGVYKPFHHLEDARAYAEKCILHKCSPYALDCETIAETILQAENHELTWLDISEEELI